MKLLIPDHFFRCGFFSVVGAIFAGPIIVYAQPFIPGYHIAPKITGYVAVVQVMKIVARHRLTFIAQTFKTQMPGGRGNRRMLKMENEMQRVGRNEKVDQRPTEIEEMLNWMHRQPGPGSGIGVQMVDTVNIFKQRPPMNQAVNKVEMGFTYHQDQKKKGDKQNRVVLKAEVGNTPVGRRPRK